MRNKKNERIFDWLSDGYGINTKGLGDYYIISICRYAPACAFIPVMELPRIPAYCPKNGSQYLDSLGGVAGVSASGSYTCNTFLLEAEERRKESLWIYEEQEEK